MGWMHEEIKSGTRRQEEGVNTIYKHGHAGNRRFIYYFGAQGKEVGLWAGHWEQWEESSGQEQKSGFLQSNTSIVIVNQVM